MWPVYNNQTTSKNYNNPSGLTHVVRGGLCCDAFGGCGRGSASVAGVVPCVLRHVVLCVACRAPCIASWVLVWCHVRHRLWVARATSRESAAGVRRPTGWRSDRRTMGALCRCL
jgi:hypothetical protein